MNSRFRKRMMKKYWSRDATQVYRELLDSHVHPGMKLLHAGCGWDKHHISLPYKEHCQVVGIDLDPRVQSMFHSEFCLGSLYEMPFGDETFDLIFSEYVFEHLDQPEAAFKEMERVLKPGGRILILTPNLFSYKGFGACFTPQAFHLFMGRIRYGKGHEADMYPTRYKCNTSAQFKGFLRSSNLKIVSLHYVTNGPTWFQKFPLVFELFHLYHSLIARIEGFKLLRCAIVAEIQKVPMPVCAVSKT